MNILFSPHNDDEVLFACYTLLREKPLVVICTDSYIQYNRGDGITAEQRREETRQAMKVLDLPVYFAGIRDDQATEEDFVDLMKKFNVNGNVYAPAVQGGNKHHDMVGNAAAKVFKWLTRYTTYTKTELWTKGTLEVVPNEIEASLKRRALACYESQYNLPSTKPHFLAVMDKTEWLL